jgi:hypothetical protein
MTNVDLVMSFCGFGFRVVRPLLLSSEWLQRIVYSVPETLGGSQHASASSSIQAWCFLWQKALNCGVPSFDTWVVHVVSLTHGTIHVVSLWCASWQLVSFKASVHFTHQIVGTELFIVFFGHPSGIHGICSVVLFFFVSDTDHLGSFCFFCS